MASPMLSPLVSLFQLDIQLGEIKNLQHCPTYIQERVQFFLSRLDTLYLLLKIGTTCKKYYKQVIRDESIWKGMWATITPRIEPSDIHMPGMSNKFLLLVKQSFLSNKFEGFYKFATKWNDSGEIRSKSLHLYVECDRFCFNITSSINYSYDSEHYTTTGEWKVLDLLNEQDYSEYRARTSKKFKKDARKGGTSLYVALTLLDGEHSEWHDEPFPASKTTKEKLRGVETSYLPVRINEVTKKVEIVWKGVRMVQMTGVRGLYAFCNAKHRAANK